MKRIAIVGNGPANLIPDLKHYSSEIDIWIGADRGASTLIENGISPDIAVGDFDSVSDAEKKKIQECAAVYEIFPSEKDQTDLEIAVANSVEESPDEIFLFGVTGGRLDHTLTNIQLLYRLRRQNIKGVLIGEQNQLELTEPGEHQLYRSEVYPYVSFVPLSHTVEGITLKGFQYPLENETICWGSALCISNRLILNCGTFSYTEGILLLIKSRDAVSTTIPL